MRIPLRAHQRELVVALAMLASFARLAAPLHAQHKGHSTAAPTADTTPRITSHFMAQAIPLITRANPSAQNRTITEGALTQTLVMGRLGWWQGRATLDATLNGEGLLMPRGELNTGASGESFVDRRHPHAYIHELVLTGRGSVGQVALSASGGRGFVPFGTDDPMVRPMVKYPINHHLAQILERGMIAGAARLGGVIVEGATFGGEEPSSPSSLPRASRFGDSWAARLTLLPVQWAEVQGSYARVASPEEPAGFGLDQRKRSLSARATSANGEVYLMAEWARALHYDHSSRLVAFAHESALIEGSAHLGSLGVALRVGALHAGTVVRHIALLDAHGGGATTCRYGAPAHGPLWSVRGRGCADCHGVAWRRRSGSSSLMHDFLRLLTRSAYA